MMKLVECIPNFSCSKEKDEATYNELVKTAQSVPGCTLFDAQTDGNHNRCVFTMVGSPEAIEEAAFQLCKKFPLLSEFALLAPGLPDISNAGLMVFSAFSTAQKVISPGLKSFDPGFGCLVFAERVVCLQGVFSIL